MIYTVEFEAAFDKLIKWEGGYVNNKNDPGGETKYGISKRQYPDIKDIKNLSVEAAKQIYFLDFWKKYKCDQFINSNIASKYLDVIVNTGPTQGTKILQRAIRAANLYIIDDGIIGQATIKAANESNPDALYAAFKSEQAAFYRMLQKNQPMFFDGWLFRAYENR